jgi:nitrogen-specific signal transduction histidine kinase
LLQGSVGLGLAIARSFAEGMDGSLDYKRIDDLTIFEVSLPLAEAVAATSDDSERVVAEAEDLETAQTV